MTDGQQPAFPQLLKNHDQFPGSSGMTLRDYFAAQALAGILRAARGSREPDGVARLSYRMADAMLAERSAR